MKALLIAGGFGTRLRPLTYTRPKHLLPIANRPHLHHVFDLVLRHGIDEVVLLTSYMAETFESSIEHGRAQGLTVHVAHEETPLGTAGAISNARDIVGDSTFFAFNGDVLTDMDLTEIANFHRAREAEATIVLTPVEDPSAYGVVPTQDDGRVVGFIEKPPRELAPTNKINAGVYVMEPSVLELIPAEVEYSAEHKLFPGMVADGRRLYATVTDAYWMDIGTPEKYLQANLDALSGRFRTDAVAHPGPDAVVCGEGARSEGAQVTSSCLGPGVSVGRDAVIERSVLLPGVVVGDSANISGSILGEDAVVEPGVQLEARTIADGEVVPR